MQGPSKSLYKRKLDNIDNGHIDVSDRDTIEYFQKEEVGIHHWDNNSVVRICDDGCIDSFVGETIGIRLDPTAQSANIFSPKVNVFGNRVNLLTNPDGLIWNSWKFNPSIYEWCGIAPLGVSTSPRNFKLMCDYEVKTAKGWEHVQILLPPYLKDNNPVKYSTDIKNIISGLGLPLPDGDE